MSLILSSLIFISQAVLAAPPTISPDTLRLKELNREPGLTIIDVRDPGAFRLGHIQGALNIMDKDVSAAGLPRTSHIVVYCGEASCPLSAGAATKLIDAGYTKVDLLEGGFTAWLAKGYPATTGTGQAANKHAQQALTTDNEALKKIAAGLALPLDVRPRLEFKAGHLPNALNVPLEDIPSRLAEIPKDKEILIYDRQGPRSTQAIKSLKTAGFTVSELSGGLAGWIKKKLPLEVK